MATYTIFNHATETGAGAGPTTDQPVSVGIIFTPLVSGTITKISFWKDVSDATTTREVAIWDPIAETNSSGDTSTSSEPVGTSQWIDVPITPFAVTANTPYMAVVHYPSLTGQYFATANYFSSSDKTNGAGTLKAYSDANARTATASAVDGPEGNARYTYFDAYNPHTSFPSQSFNAANYWVDVELTINATVVIGDKVLDNGLNYLDTNCDKIFVCSQMPTNYTDATSTSALGNYNWGAGNAFPADGAKSGGGRQITSNAITNGSITASGAVVAWAAVDTVNSLLLASGGLNGGAPVSSGQTFSLGQLTIGIPNK